MHITLNLFVVIKVKVNDQPIIFSMVYNQTTISGSQGQARLKR